MTYFQSDLIDIATNMILQWSNYSNYVLDFSADSLTDYATLNYTISNVKLSDAGQYTCSFIVNATIDNPFILASDIMADMVNVSINSKWILNHYVINVFQYQMKLTQLLLLVLTHLIMKLVVILILVAQLDLLNQHTLILVLEYILIGCQEKFQQVLFYMRIQLTVSSTLYII